MRKTAVLLALLATTPALAADPPRPVVIELFTSQGCSSCPPADRLLTELARSRPDVLPLAFHVTYWNALGWRDPYSLEAATARQRSYQALAGVYTPQAVIDGSIDAVGSDEAAVRRALARATPATAIPLQASRAGAEIAITAGPGGGRGTLLLVGYDRSHTTPVGRGENAGATLTESNIVRSLTVLGAWTGAALSLHAPVPEGEAFAVLLQAPSGQIIGAARVATPAA
jgi:hypothetical protein